MTLWVIVKRPLPDWQIGYIHHCTSNSTVVSVGNHKKRIPPPTPPKAHVICKQAYLGFGVVTDNTVYDCNVQKHLAKGLPKKRDGKHTSSAWSNAELIGSWCFRFVDRTVGCQSFDLIHSLKLPVHTWKYVIPKGNWFSNHPLSGASC